MEGRAAEVLETHQLIGRHNFMDVPLASFKQCIVEKYEIHHLDA